MNVVSFIVAKFFVLKLKRIFSNKVDHSEETGTPWGLFSSVKIFGEDDLGRVGLVSTSQFCKASFCCFCLRCFQEATKRLGSC